MAKRLSSTWVIAPPVLSPFGATSFGDEVNTRPTIEFKLDKKQVAHWEAVDKWAIAYLVEHSDRLFKKVLTIEQVKEAYKSPVTRKEGYQPHLRCKINTSGDKACRAGILTAIALSCLPYAKCYVCLGSLFLRISGL